MPDISMCQETCPLSAKCRRHVDSGTIPDPYRQSMLKPDPVGGLCDYYWPISRHKKEIKP